MEDFSDKIKTNKTERILSVFLIGFIVLYPLVNAFLGLDLGDTGFHLFNYENLMKRPELINYSTILSTLLGNIWFYLFGGLGLIGFNLLQVAFELLLSYFVYRVLKPLLGKIPVLIGLALAIMATGTYLNIFNYHQFSVFLLTLSASMILNAISAKKLRYTVISGFLFACLVFSRVASITAVTLLFLYIYDYYMTDQSAKALFKNMGVWLLSASVSAAVMAAFFHLFGVLRPFINNIFRLYGIGSTESTGYGFRRLIKIFVIDNLETISIGFIFFSAMAVILLVLNFFNKKIEPRKTKVMGAVFMLIFSVVAIFQVINSFEFIESEPWPQVTTGPRFVIGIFYVIAFLVFIAHFLKNNERSHQLALTAIAGIFIVLLTVAGTNTGTKHVILSLWILAPLAAYFVRTCLFNEKVLRTVNRLTNTVSLPTTMRTLTISVLIFSLLFSYKFMHMVYFTNNFDAANRMTLTYRVESPKLRGIVTTKREAETLNGTLGALAAFDQDEPLLVFGASLLFYYLTERDPYIRPWVTPNTYTNEQFQNDVSLAYEAAPDRLPLIVFCRTNYSWGFEEETFSQNRFREKSLDYAGKKTYLVDFLTRKKYAAVYVDDYHVVFRPSPQHSDPLQIERLVFDY